MLLRKYRIRMRKIEPALRAQITQMLRIPCKPRGKDGLFNLLEREGYDQADLVLCLLRLNTPQSLKHAERLVGRKITHCPPALRWKALPVNVPDRVGDDRRVTYVEKNPRLKSGRTSWLRRYHLFNVGLTVAQLMKRGITRYDLSVVLKRGWLRLETA
jgi:hypothetical protein